jgi:cell division protein FtsZ
MEKAENNKAITVVGLGGAGVKIVSRLTDSPHAGHLKLLAVDTDLNILDNSPLKEEQKFLADNKWRQGKGCGGNVLEGQRSISRERADIEDLISNSSLLIVTGGLGGGTATGGVAVLAGIAKKLQIPSIFIITMPFSLEGHSKRRTAENGVKELLPVADILLYLPNDLLFSSLSGDTAVDQAFKMADNELARTIIGVSEIITHKNLLAASLSDIKEALNKKKSYASIGVGIADSNDGLNRNHIALQRMLDSPLLGGMEKIKEADTVIVSLTGGSDLKIDETKKTLEAFEKFISPECNLIVGANTAENYGDQVQITAIAVKFDAQSVKNDQPQQMNFGVEKIKETPEDKSRLDDLFGGAELEQAELPLQNISRGIFLNTSPINYQGEDLDVPTFQRKGIIIDKG